ncbi:5-bromo-4-chloroindolyl phosphate hydrolysis family protein [uncultured Thiohalocapsa sp.]|uniref:5-bromo-4-chloroindolyl phosphate hydrolysis family protein n=1 Tax=uncultured Thiohalocapsa sp. TaxID=768990 RepID=UPI0025DE64DF|nr:5-bromo-4-chloroindolyl phosphate hydrolysis family protein [uncultured Thiohalocapsa sp.]
MKRVLLLAVIIAIAAVLVTVMWRRLAAQGSADRQAANAEVAVPDWLLFVLPLPAAAAALIALIRGELTLLLGDGLGYGLLLGGALLARRGLAGARWRRWSPKRAGAVLLALGSGVTAWLGAGHHPAIGGAFALVTLLGFHLVYALDLSPLRRRPQDLGRFGAASLRRAAASIAAIEQASRRIRQPELDERLASIAGLARQILTRVQDDPRDLWRARKFLNVYLDGVQRVVEGYAKTHSEMTAPALEQRFRHALETVETAFREQYQVLLERDVEDLDVQIEVLTRQLEREGML